MTREEFEQGCTRFLESIRKGVQICAERESELNEDLKNGIISQTEWEEGIKENRRLLGEFERQLNQYQSSLKKLKRD